MNAIWTGEGAQELSDVDISVAVATDNGLITPIVKDVPGLGLKDITAKVRVSTNYSFYCVNTSYPMDNCFTGRRDRSRQTPEKDVLYIIPAGPVSSVHSLGGASYLLPV